MQNYELQLLDKLEELFTDQSFNTEDGVEAVQAVYQGDYPDRAPGVPFIVLVPLGMQLPKAVAGANQSRLSRRDYQVVVVVELHYEHADARSGVRNLSSIGHQVLDILLGPRRVLDETSLELVDISTSYSTRKDDTDSDRNLQWGFKGVTTFAVEATWRLPAATI